MSSATSRVTIVSRDRRMDLTLPDAVAIGELMPQLVQCCVAAVDRHSPVVWMLRPVGGAELRPTSTLRSAKVRDGTILELCQCAAAAPNSLVEDVRDVVEDAVDETMRIWGRRDSTTLSVLTVAALGASLAIMMVFWPDVWSGRTGIAIPLTAMVAAGAVWSAIGLQRRSFGVSAHALLLTGLVWTGVLVLVATVATATDGNRPSSGVLAAATGAVVGAVAAGVTRATPGFASWVAASAVVLGLGFSWAAAELADRSVRDWLAMAAVTGVLTVGILPRACLAAGGLPALDHLARTTGGAARPEVVAVHTRAQAYLTGALLTTAIATAFASAALSVRGSPMQVATAAAVSMCLVLRSRAFTRFTHVLTLVVSGVGSVVVASILNLLDSGAGEAPTSSTALLALGIVFGGSAVCAATGLLASSEVAAARGRRLLDGAESVAVTSLLPLLAACLGAFDWVAGLVD